jgi:hypothetical protein
MKHRTWIVALLAALVVTGALAAQTPSTGPQATAPAAPTHPTLSAAQLAQILGTGEPDGISTTPAPVWETCTLFQCRQPCSGCKFEGIGCIGVCVDLTNCICECQC